MENKTPNIKGMGYLSPNYYVNPFEFPNKILRKNIKTGIWEVLDKNIETKISVYEDRIKGWFLDFARKLTKEDNSEFIVLMICMNYLEGNQQFREGRTSNGESTEMLKRALKRIFLESSEEDIDYLIDKVRHGLFHDGMTRRDAVLGYGASIPFFFFTIGNERWIRIDPSLFLEKIEKDFEEYINTLKDDRNNEEREKFERHYNERYEEPPDI